MDENYYASICYNGVHGGAIKLTDEYMLFRCKKITISEELKKLTIPYENIADISYKIVLLFPVVKIELINRNTYNFIIFNYRHFIKTIKVFIKN